MRLMPWRATAIRTPFDNLHEEFDRMVHSLLGAPVRAAGARDAVAFVPEVDVVDRGDAIAVRAELPGLDAKDVKLTVERDHLILTGEKKAEHSENGKEFARFECRYGAFSRVVPLPVEVVGNKATAVYKNGVLEVTLPKSDSARAQSVEIKVQS